VSSGYVERNENPKDLKGLAGRLPRAALQGCLAYQKLPPPHCDARFLRCRLPPFPIWPVRERGGDVTRFVLEKAMKSTSSG